MIFAFDEYELDADRLELKREGVPVRADRMVLRLLAVLVREAGELVSREQLLARVWERRAVSRSVISVAMTRLRQTLGRQAGGRTFVVSVQGRGYRFVRPVRALTAQAHATDPRSVSAEHDVLFGREPALRSLRGALEAARAGRGSMCVLGGEPGIGKTALAERISAEAEHEGLPVVWAYCQEVGETPPLWPFAQLARALVSDDQPLAPELRWLLGVSPGAAPGARHRLFEAVLDALERAAGSAACLLVIDDLHRADGASLELLRYWVGRIARTRVLLVATVRSGERAHALASADLRFVLAHRNCTRIRLDRLEQTDVRAYAARVLDDPDGTLTRTLWHESEGNPFFMVELARQLADAGARGARVEGPALDAWHARIRTLDQTVRGALSRAAVIGRRFELRLLQEVSGQALDTLVAQLDAAVASETVLPAAGADTAYAFGHELIRKLLYDALPPPERRALHRVIGETLARRGQRGEPVPSSVLAHHFHAALPDADPSIALRHCQHAALEATYAFAHADAMRQLQRALDALSLFAEPSPATHWVLLLQRAVAARMAGAPEFERLVHEAAQVARAARSGAFLIEAGMLLHLHPGLPLPARAGALLEEGLALARPEDEAQRGAALARLCGCGPVAFDLRRAHAQIDQALGLVSRSGALLPSYNANAAALYLHAGRGGDTAAAERSRAALEQLARQVPGVLRVAPILLDLHDTIVAQQAGQLDEAHAHLARMTERCAQMGTRELGWYAERAQLLMQLARHPLALVANALRALHARARRESIIGSDVMVAFDQGVVLAEPADPARLRTALAPAADDPPSIWSLKLHALAAAGLHREAQAALAAVPPEALARLPRDRDFVGTLGAVARAALALNAREHAWALLPLLAPHGACLVVHASFVCLGPVALLSGELACALGRGEEAAAHFHSALRTAERLGLHAHAEAARAGLRGTNPRGLRATAD